MAHYSALKRIFGTALQTTAVNALSPFLWRQEHNQGWAQGSFVEAEVKVEFEADAKQTKFEARSRRGDPLKKNPLSPRCIAVPNLVALSQTV